MEKKSREDVYRKLFSLLNLEKEKEEEFIKRVKDWEEYNKTQISPIHKFVYYLILGEYPIESELKDKFAQLISELLMVLHGFGLTIIELQAKLVANGHDIEELPSPLCDLSGHQEEIRTLFEIIEKNKK